MARASRTKRGATSQEERLLAAIDSIYEAALTPGLWPEALSQVSALCGARWIIFSATALDPFEPKTSIQNTEADPEQLKLMMERYSAPEHNPAIPAILASPVGQIARREAQFGNQEWECTDIYQEAYRPFGIYSAFAVPLVKSERYFVPMGIGRAKSLGDFEQESFTVFGRLIPHLQRAMQLMLHLDTLGLHVTTMQAAWDRLPYGVMVVDAAGRMLWSNRAGGEILAENDHLVVRGLVLHASASDVDRELCKLISEAARTGSDGGLHAGGALQVPRRAPARPLSVLVSPLRPGEPGAFFLPSSAAVLLLVIDPDRRRELPPTVLMRLYQLTRMEAALAVRIASGMTLERAADELTIATSTARLHLQRVLRKTGTHRQVELVRLLLTIIPPGF